MVTKIITWTLSSSARKNNEVNCSLVSFSKSNRWPTTRDEKTFDAEVPSAGWSSLILQLPLAFSITIQSRSSRLFLCPSRHLYLSLLNSTLLNIQRSPSSLIHAVSLTHTLSLSLAPLLCHDHQFHLTTCSIHRRQSIARWPQKFQSSLKSSFTPL